MMCSDHDQHTSRHIMKESGLTYSVGTESFVASHTFDGQR